MKETEKVLTKKQWNDITKKSGTLNRKCSNCGVVRTYRTLLGYNRSINTMCKSCSNTKNASGRIARAVNGMKNCFQCKQNLPVAEFFLYKGKSKHGRYHSLCNVCKKEKFKQYQKTVGRFKRYGITKNTYDIMYEEQSGKCYICGKHETKLHIDHNHVTGKVRSLLCKECNMALGLLKENVGTLRNIIEYLEKDRNAT